MNANNLLLSVILWQNVLTLKDHFLVNATSESLEMVLSIVQVYTKTSPLYKEEILTLHA